MTKITITDDMVIATVMDKFPATKPVFKRYLGKNCEDCPGSSNEDIAFGSMMHNVELDTLLKALNKAVNS